MATIAYPDTEARPGAKPPISLHPAFPAVVALWFAVLLGLGSLVLPAALLERATVATDLAVWVPAAAPPLGLTARALIALLAAATGALGGRAIARRVAGLHAAEAGGRFDAELTRFVRPLDVREDLGEDDFPPAPESLPLRRRALALAENDDPRTLPVVAPPPFREASWAEPDEGHEAGGAHDIDEADGTEDHAALHEAPDDEPDIAVFDEDPVFDEAPVFDEDYAMTDNPQFLPPIDDDAYDSPCGHAGPAPVAQSYAPESEPGSTPEPLPFAAPSFARRTAAQPEAPEAAIEPVAFRGDWTDTPLDRLGLVQLVERLGASLERRRLRTAAAASAQPAAAPVVPAGFEAAPAEDAAQAMASYFGRPAGVPAPESTPDQAPQAVAEPVPAPAAAAPKPDLMQRFGAMLGGTPDDENDDADWLAGLSLPLRKSGRADEEETAADEERCGSLLGMRNAAARRTAEVVRFDEADPAGRSFDAPGGDAEPEPEPLRPSPGETDAALRAALATLQRTRGAA